MDVCPSQFSPSFPQTVAGARVILRYSSVCLDSVQFPHRREKIWVQSPVPSLWLHDTEQIPSSLWVSDFASEKSGRCRVPFKSTQVPGVPWWLSRWSIQLHHCCGAGSLPNLGTSACHGCNPPPPPPQKKKKKRKKVPMSSEWLKLRRLSPERNDLKGNSPTTWEAAVFAELVPNSTTWP